MKAWSGDAGQIAQAVVQDTTATVSEAWTGPQVAWKMARGREGSFGGKTLLKPYVWLAFCLVFLVGLADLRRPLSLRNFDLLVLLSFSVSLAFFDRGEIFSSVPLVYPVLGYFLVRSAWVGIRKREAALRPVWPTWAFAAAAVFLLGFRVGLNVETPRGVIDVGLAGVVGASRILDGEAPYGNMPQRGDLEPCGPKDADGEVRERIQTNGRCEAGIERGDTYGPVAYVAYVPAVLVFEWSGKWDSLPAAHATSILFDVLTILGLVLVGLRFGGVRLAARARVRLVRVSVHRVRPEREHERHDHARAARLRLLAGVVGVGARIGGCARRVGEVRRVAPRAALGQLPDARAPRRVLKFAVAFAAATVASFVILLLEPSLWRAIRTFWDRTVGFQAGRDSPFSLWGWGQYHAEGIPDLGFVQPALAVLAVAIAIAAAFVPREKGPIELAALTAAVLVAFQLSLTHWFYLYLPWFLPFVLLWLLLPREPDQGNGMRSGSIAEALPDSESQSITTPSTRTPP